MAFVSRRARAVSLSRGDRRPVDRLTTSRAKLVGNGDRVAIGALLSAQQTWRVESGVERSKGCAVKNHPVP